MTGEHEKHPQVGDLYVWGVACQGGGYLLYVITRLDHRDHLVRAFCKTPWGPWEGETFIRRDTLKEEVVTGGNQRYYIRVRTGT